MEVPYTRIVEYKHKPNQPKEVFEKKGTVIFKEYSVDEGDPYYPVPNPDNQALFERYKAKAAVEPGVVFVGRLASYKYFNMDQARALITRDAPPARGAPGGGARLSGGGGGGGGGRRSSMPWKCLTGLSLRGRSGAARRPRRSGPPQSRGRTRERERAARV